MSDDITKNRWIEKRISHKILSKKVPINIGKQNVIEDEEEKYIKSYTFKIIEYCEIYNVLSLIVYERIFPNITAINHFPVSDQLRVLLIH